MSSSDAALPFFAGAGASSGGGAFLTGAGASSSAAATKTPAHFGHFIFLPSDAVPTFSLAPHSVQATITLSGAAAGAAFAGAPFPDSATNTLPHEHFTFLPIEVSATFSFFEHSGQLTIAMKRYLAKRSSRPRRVG